MARAAVPPVAALATRPATAARLSSIIAPVLILFSGMMVTRRRRAPFCSSDLAVCSSSTTTW